MTPLHMRPHGTGGFLITVCGLDGCGKSTMLRRLASDLEHSRTVIVTKQPTPAVRQSHIFRTYMDSPHHDGYDYRGLSLLAASDRLEHCSRVILPELRAGHTVISDRYFYSCLANLRARGYRTDRWIYEIARSILRPDLALFFDAPVEVAVARVRARPEERDRYIDMDLQHRLRREYIEICRANGGVLISTEQSEDASYAQVLEALERRNSHEH